MGKGEFRRCSEFNFVKIYREELQNLNSERLKLEKKSIYLTSINKLPYISLTYTRKSRSYAPLVANLVDQPESRSSSPVKTGIYISYRIAANCKSTRKYRDNS